MNAKKLGATAADLQVNDNGTLTINLTFLDQDQEPTTNIPSGLSITYDVVGPDGVTVVPVVNWTPAPGGPPYSANGAVIQPPPNPLPTGLQARFTIASGLAGQTAPEVGLATPPFDLIPGPAGSAIAVVSTP